MPKAAFAHFLRKQARTPFPIALVRRPWHQRAMHVLVIEDNQETADYITRGLGEAGWTTEHFADAQSALLAAGAPQVGAIVLDRMLPGMDGIDALKLLRGAGVATPVLMLTAMSRIEDRVDGLEAGADDYLVKPFALSELIARLKSLARRPTLQKEKTRLEVGDLVLDRVAHEARRGDHVLDLSPLEFKLLDCLMDHREEVVTKTMLLEKVWGYRFDPKTSLVQTHMSRLRAKVDKGFETEMISTVRGAGYVIRDR